MHRISSRHPRLCALSAATAFVVASVFATAASAAGPIQYVRVNTSALDSGASTDRFIVKYRSDSVERRDAGELQRSLSAAANAAARTLGANGAGAKAAPAIGLRRAQALALGAELVTANRKLAPAEAEALMRRIAENPNVEYVEVDREMVLYMTPNDPEFPRQYGYGTGPGGIRAGQAWDRSTGAGVVVGVIDSGVNRHADLAANLVAGWDFAQNDNDPSDPTDAASFHGTHVAGTVAAVTNNSLGVAGTAPGAKILPVRVFNGPSGSTSAIVNGITWAVGGSVPGVPANANPADVINLSLGSRFPATCDNATRDALNFAISRGTIVVVAAGNSNGDANSYTLNNCAPVISVGSVTNTGARSSFSNHGTRVDVAAPGSDIVSTSNGFNGANNLYQSLSGTSMASPHVAGVAALVQSAASTPLTQAQMSTLLKNTARAFPVTPDRPIGAGIVDANAAVLAAGGGTPGNQAPVANFASSANGLTVSFTDSSSDSDGSIASRSWDFGDGTTSTAANPSKTYAAAGTYTVKLTVVDNAGASNTKTATVTVGSSGGVQTYTNGTDANIPDNNATGITSSISVTGRSGNAPSNAQVAVNIVHSYKGDLIVDLVAPDGSVYNLHNRTGSSTDNINQTFTVNLSSEALNGTWKLRAADRAAQDVGRIDSWSVTF
ncbi:S8 family serine peptidase [Lysobacter yananisis]|uniref:S8 family serine peptidase n=1 Tax=Lysobacter yananisis TaxID=1003114 RepID=A0ABY9P4V1_9GAMM|nr:S8 family serine peptidase [Lysobacter yananisis]WMT01060.1 S8 family serine peptidase [Lysobacter yananisis]